MAPGNDDDIGMNSAEAATGSQKPFITPAIDRLWNHHGSKKA